MASISPPDVIRSLRRAASCIALAIALLVPTATLCAGSPGMQVVDRIDVGWFGFYLEEVLYAHDGDNRGRYGPEHDPARDNIEALLRGYGLYTYLDEFQWDGNTWSNVVAVKPGAVTPERQYIVSGHFDSVGNPGANDDATGCAGVLELARVLSRYEFESTIVLIAFDLEESGLIGSRHYAPRHAEDDIRGMISLEMLAYDDGSGSSHIYGRDASDGVKLALADAVETYGDGLTAHVFGQLDRSDHAPFEWAGKPACVFVQNATDNDPCYHRACDSVDTPDYLDYDFAIKLVRSVAGYLVDHAGLIVVPGDVDVDGDVDFDDLTMVLAAWGPCGVEDCPEDVDGDGDVGFADLLLVLTNWS